MREVLADLERFAPQEIDPAHYVDIGDEAEFVPEVLEGECGA